MLGQLAHPCLARVLDIVEIDGHLYLVLAFHDGRTLGDLIETARGEAEPRDGPHRWLVMTDREKPPDAALRELLGYFLAVAEALATAHDQGVVHRDLKPHNLMVKPDGGAIVLDFGLALPEADTRLTIAGELLGTPLYMAPEQVEGGPVDARTDVYALGVTLYEALTLTQPFAGAGGRAGVFQRVLRGEPSPPRSVCPAIPRDLGAVVLRAIERSPGKRYPDMRAFARDLRRVIELEPTEARPLSGFSMAWRRVSRRRWLILGAVITVASAAIALRSVVAGETGGGGGARDIPEPTDMVLVYPFGRVLAPKQVVWLGMPVRGVPRGDDENLRYSYEYEIELTCDGETLARGTVASAGKRLMQWTVPGSMSWEAGRDYGWSVQVRAFEVGLAGEVEVTEEGLMQVKEANGVLVADLNAAYALQAVFAIAPSQPGAGGDLSSEGVAALLDEGLPSDALSRVLELAGKTTIDAGLRQRLKEALPKDPDSALSGTELDAILDVAEREAR